MLHAIRSARSLFIASLFCLAAGHALADKTDRTRDLERLAEAERTWVRALETGDVRLLETFVDEACTFIGPDGQFEEREAYLAGYRQLPSMGVQVKKISVDQVKMRVLGDTAIVTGHVVAQLSMQGQPLVEDVRFTRVYARRGDKWRMVAGQGTRLAPPAR
ncbi:MAG TPA: nuclear transport factor 2 family protein [Polyangiales bacterium]|nr:nuclear transport factor 2 family protein [Polyangiales bacterium]